MARGGACERFCEDLSAFADGTLPPARWEQVAYHVAGCQPCQRDLAAIRRVCRTLRSRGPEVACTPSLAARLESIAGESGDAPLYMTPRAGATCLPSRRGLRLRRLTQGGLAAFAAVASMAMLSLLLAPEPPRVSDAVGKARENYSLSVTAVNVSSAVGAVLLAHERGAAPGEPVEQRPRASIVSAPRQLPDDAATAFLSQRPDLTFTGLQRVWVADGKGTFQVTDVRIDEAAGQGATLEVLDSRGNTYNSWFVPNHLCCGTGSRAPGGWDFYQYQGRDQVAGRWATVIEARDGNRPVARWWVDEETGLVLWSEHLDSLGELSLVAGFTQLRVGQAQLEVGGAELVVVDSPKPDSAPGWCVGLAACPEQLAGLPLAAHSSTQAHGRQSMNLIYSDGFRHLNVTWTEGILDETGTRVEAAAPGQPQVAVWQADAAVVSVATNGGTALIEEAARHLPTEKAWQPTLLERFQDGLDRISGTN